MANLRISVQTARSYREIGIAPAYEMYKRVGFEAVDWNIDNVLVAAQIRAGNFRNSLYTKPLEEVLAHYAPELEQLKKNGLAITQAHAPFPAYEPELDGLLEEMIPVYQRCIELCDAVGCKHLVIHGISHKRNDTVNTPESIYQLNVKLYTSLIPLLQKTNVTVCMENLFTSTPHPKGNQICAGHCSDPKAAAEFIDWLNGQAGKECFGLCLDVGHLNVLRIDERVYIATLGKRIKVLHLHDNDGIKDQHIAPYNGNIHWKNILTSLAKAGYEGDLSFEAFQQTTLQNIDEGVLESQLRAIADTGKFFRDEILRIRGEQ